ncbi:hypothetical protein [Robertmurraya kyonggiensis]|nr:hypothetical protein [Robertmurraya kyonggiensis]
MKQIMIALVLILSIIVVGCTNKEEEKVNKEEKEVSTVNEVTEEETKEDAPKKETTLDEDSMKRYRPEVGVKKTFIEAGDFAGLQEEFPYGNEDYIQRVVRIGESVAVQVYKWTENEISLVLEEKDLEDPNKNYLSDLSEEVQDTLYAENGGANWEIVSENETVEVPYGKFTNVYVLRKVTDEVEGADTIYTYYIAPEVGLIKETFELTGEQGYSAESVLQTVEK